MVFHITDTFVFLKGREATEEVLCDSEDEVFARETTSHAINSKTFVNIWWTPAHTIPKDNI